MGLKLNQDMFETLEEVVYEARYKILKNKNEGLKWLEWIGRDLIGFPTLMIIPCNFIIKQKKYLCFYIYVESGKGFRFEGKNYSGFSFQFPEFREKKMYDLYIDE